MDYIYIVIYAITVLFFVIMMNLKDKAFTKERTDYINRIMSKNTQDYIKLANKEEKKVLTDSEILGSDFNGILN